VPDRDDSITKATKQVLLYLPNFHPADAAALAEDL
jgi:hypothetical protein